MSILNSLAAEAIISEDAVAGTAGLLEASSRRPRRLGRWRQDPRRRTRRLLRLPSSAGARGGASPSSRDSGDPGGGGCDPMMPVSRRNLDWTYSSVGTGNRGALECPIPGPASRRQAVCSQLGTPKPIPKLIVHALPSAPPLPGGHAFPPLTSVVAGPACS